MLVVGWKSNAKSPMKTEASIHRWWLSFFLVAAVIGLLIGFAIPDFLHSGTSKLSIVWNHVRQITGAKEEWALEHGLTNAPLPSRAVTVQDLAPYLPPMYTQKKEFGAPAFGELYLIGDLNQPAEAVLTRGLTERDGRSLCRSE